MTHAKHITADDVLTPEVLQLLKKATGLGNQEAWNNVWLLISKSEQNNEDKNKAFLDDKGHSLFGYASALSYDRKQRGVTCGIVGFTSADDGKDGQGDLPAVLKQYARLGGDDLMPYIDGCCKSQQKCDALIKKIKNIADDPKWIQAQFDCLLTKDGYISQAMKAWEHVGVHSPSYLGLATVFDHCLNTGSPGKLVKLGVHGDEDKTLEKFNDYRRTELGKNEYNDPPSNGRERADMFEKLRKAGCFSLKQCDEIIQKAIHWEMK